MWQERFGKQKMEDIESAAAFVLYKDGKLNEALQLYKRIIARGKVCVKQTSLFQSK